MKKGIMLTGSGVMLAAVMAARADDLGQLPLAPSSDGLNSIQVETKSFPSLTKLQANSDELYRDNEASLDLFGGGTLNEHDIDRLSGARIHHDGRLGLGAGGTVFLSRNLGLMGEAYTENPDGHFIDEASGSVVLRFPLDPTGLAPYIFGGGGHQFDPQEATFGHAGAGLEFRFLPNMGIFADGRWVFTDRIGNYGMARAGLRLVF